MTSFEAKISLAISVKLQNIFNQNADKFLAFTNNVSYPYKFLNFTKDAVASGMSAVEQYNAKVQFARDMNLVVADKIFYEPDAARPLSALYTKFLTDAVFAQSSLTLSENNQLEEAIDFLTDIESHPDGTTVSVLSDNYNRYLEYKTIYELIEREYLDKKFSVEQSAGQEGEALKHAWETYEKKIWEEKLRSAENDWINLGFKTTVRGYESIRATLEPKKFLGLYREACLDEIDSCEIPDLNAGGTTNDCITLFSPSDIFDKNAIWNSITLYKSEIDILAFMASPMLKARYAPSGNTSGESIEKITFEYNKAVVVRPWLRMEFFDSKVWRSPDDTIVSDGNIPRNGKIPSFISSMIVIRNVVITKRKNVQVKPTSLPVFSVVPLKDFKINQTIKAVAVQPKVVKAEAQTVKPFVVEKMNWSNFAVKKQAADMTLKPEKFAPKSTLFFGGMSINTVHAVSGNKKSDDNVVIKKQVLSDNMKRSFVESKQRKSTITVNKNFNKKDQLYPKIPSQVTVTNPVSSPELVEERVDFDGVIVVAYECRRMPKSPTPDLNLSW